MFNLNKSKTICNTKLNTNKNDKPVNERMDDYIQIRMSKEWKNKVKMISEMNNVSFSQFIRQSVEKNIQSLSR